GNARDNAGRPALMFFNSLQKYQLLLDQQAEVNAQDNDGKTALYHAAIMFQDAERVRFLLEHGARVSIKDKRGMTALDRVLMQDTARLLKEALRKEQGQKRARPS